VLERAEQDGSSVAAAARAIADYENVSLDRARKAALFAKTFSRQDIARLCDPGPGWSPLSADHIRRVLKIANRWDRMRWLDRAAAKGWSARRLDRELQRAAGSAGGKGGPRLQAPGDLLAVLEQILEHSDRWLKRYDGLWVHDFCWPPVVGLGMHEPAVLRDCLREARCQLGRLGQAVELLGKRLKRLERGLRGRASREGAGKAAAPAGRE
jgi:hypothetical protein